MTQLSLHNTPARWARLEDTEWLSLKLCHSNKSFQFSKHSKMHVQADGSREWESGGTMRVASLQFSRPATMVGV